MAKKEITQQDPAPLSEVDELEALLKEAGNAGTENITSQDIVLPRLLLLQPTSPLASEEPFRSGYFANSVDRTNFGTSVSVYVVHFYPTRTKWANEELGGPVECSSQDNLTGSEKDALHGHGHCSVCPFSSWVKDGDGKNHPPECIEFKNLIVIPANNVESIPLLFSMKRTALRAAQQFLSAVKYSKGPMFAYSYTIKSNKQESDKGTYYVPEFIRGDKVSSVSVLRHLIEMNKQMKEAQDRIVGPANDDLEGEAGNDGEDDESAF